MKPQSKEEKLLTLSIVAGSFFAVTGILWGLNINSGMMIFDGMYSLISAFLSYCAISVARQVAADYDSRFPFGRSRLEPLMVIFKSLLLLAFFSYAAADAVLSIINGGRSSDIGSAIVYSILSTLGCLAVYVYLKIKTKKKTTDLLKAESNQWMGDTLVSLGLLVGFCLALFFKKFGFNELVPYIDPAMVIVAVVIFIPHPLRSLLASGKEIADMSPDRSLVKKISGVCEELSGKYGFKDKRLHISKSGRELSVEVNYLTNSNRNLSVREMDIIRNELKLQLSDFAAMCWINVSITSEEQWL